MIRRWEEKVRFCKHSILKEADLIKVIKKVLICNISTIGVDLITRKDAKMLENRVGI